MTRLVRLNEVQYAVTQEQARALMAQGFEIAPLPVETPKTAQEDNEPPETPQEPKADKPVRDGKAKSRKAESGGKEEKPPESDEYD